MDYLRVDTDVDSRWTKEASDLTHWLPLRINAIHICNDMDPIKQFWARFTVAMTDSELRNNFRIHRGEYLASTGPNDLRPRTSYSSRLCY